MRQLKAKIRAEKTESGRYCMVAILPNMIKEYPQEGLEHNTIKEVFADARAMYNNQSWNWDEKYHTIDIDMENYTD